MKRRLRVARDMRHNTLEYLRLVRSGSQIRILILKLDFLPAEVVPKTIKRATLVFFALFIVKGVIFDALPHAGGIFIQNTPHDAVRGGALCSRRHAVL